MQKIWEHLEQPPRDVEFGETILHFLVITLCKLKRLLQRQATLEGQLSFATYTFSETPQKPLEGPALVADTEFPVKKKVEARAAAKQGFSEGERPQSASYDLPKN